MSSATRTLEGSLEDLDLTEVLRVIALARRSGTLAIESRAESALIRFAAGRVVSVRSSSETATLGDVLLFADVLNPSALARGDAGTLDDVLRAVAADEGDDGVFARAEQAIADKLTDVVAHLASLREGRFTYTTTDAASEALRYARDTAYTLVEGRDGDALVRELRKRRAAPKRDGLPRPRADREPADGPAAEIVLIDDDARALAALEGEARAAGLETTCALGARPALDALARLTDDAPRVAVLKLVMPRSTGKGILGGLEVLRRAVELGVASKVLLVMDAPHDDARDVALQMGVRDVIVRSSVDAPLSEVLNKALAALGRAPLVDEPIDLAAELMRETGETEWARDPELKLDDSARNLEVLKSLLAQVTNPTFEDEIPLLLLRFAAAYFARGALFAHHRESGLLVGIGGFGLQSADPGRTIHAIHVPTNAETVFSRAVRERAGVRQHFFDSEWNARLSSALGGPRPSEVYTAPLLSPRGLEAVLYADNATTGRAFPDTLLLEIFVQQAGAALERSSLKRKVDELLGARGVAA